MVPENASRFLVSAQHGWDARSEACEIRQGFG